MEDESKRIKEQRRTELRDEALNPTKEAMETGRENRSKIDAQKSVRNVNSYENEFGSKKANPGDRERMPITDQKRRQDSNLSDEDFERAEKEKREKQRRQEERSKEWGE